MTKIDITKAEPALERIEVVSGLGRLISAK